MLCGKIVTIFYHSTIIELPQKTSRCIIALCSGEYIIRFVVCGKKITIDGKSQMSRIGPKKESVRGFERCVSKLLPLCAAGDLGGFFPKVLCIYRIGQF